MELDGNKYYPTSLAVFIGSTISFPGMLVFDPKRLADEITYSVITVTITHLKIAGIGRKEASP